MKAFAFAQISAVLFLASFSQAAPPPPSPLCGLSGSIEARIASCAAFLRGSGERGDVQRGWSLVSVLPNDFRIYRDEETGRLWTQPLFDQDYSHFEASVACGSALFNHGLRDAYPADFGLPSLEDFRVAASHQLSDAIWLASYSFWASDLSPDFERAAFFASSNGKTGFAGRKRYLHFFNVMKAICVSR